MKIRKYINAKELPDFKEAIEYLYECEYCLQNYDEEGNKTKVEIFAEELMQEFLKNGQKAAENLYLKIIEENKLPFWAQTAIQYKFHELKGKK